jgi:hypothetical protein
MKILAAILLFFILYWILRPLFPRKTGSGTKRDETLPPEAPDGYEAVVRKRYVLPDRSSLGQQKDKNEEADKANENAHIFAAGNEISDRAIIPTDELADIFEKEVNPENLDIEKDGSETGSIDELNTEEEAEELRQMMGGVIEGYSEGIPFDELTRIFHAADTCPEQMTEAEAETLRNISTTDAFEQLVSSKEGMAARIAYLLEREVQRIAQDEAASEDRDTEYKDFDIRNYKD